SGGHYPWGFGAVAGTKKGGKRCIGFGQEGVKEKQEKDKNRIKTGQKWEAYRSPEQSKAVPVKEKQEKDKIETKPDKIKIKREAWKTKAEGVRILMGQPSPSLRAKSI
nr:hypothetical protein [Tanacetum cinerariifolium]